MATPAELARIRSLSRSEVLESLIPLGTREQSRMSAALTTMASVPAALESSVNVVTSTRLVHEAAASEVERAAERTDAVEKEAEATRAEETAAAQGREALQADFSEALHQVSGTAKAVAGAERLHAELVTEAETLEQRSEAARQQTAATESRAARYLIQLKHQSEEVSSAIEAAQLSIESAEKGMKQAEGVLQKETTVLQKACDAHALIKADFDAAAESLRDMQDRLEYASRTRQAAETEHRLQLQLCEETLLKAQRIQVLETQCADPTPRPPVSVQSPVAGVLDESDSTHPLVGAEGLSPTRHAPLTPGPRGCCRGPVRLDMEDVSPTPSPRHPTASDRNTSPTRKRSVSLPPPPVSRSALLLQLDEEERRLRARQEALRFPQHQEQRVEARAAQEETCGASFGQHTEVTPLKKSYPMSPPPYSNHSTVRSTSSAVLGNMMSPAPFIRHSIRKGHFPNHFMSPSRGPPRDISRDRSYSPAPSGRAYRPPPPPLRPLPAAAGQPDKWLSPPPLPPQELPPPPPHRAVSR